MRSGSKMILATFRCVGKEPLAVSSRAGIGGCLRTARHCSFAFLSRDHSDDWLKKTANCPRWGALYQGFLKRVFSLKFL